MKAKLGIAVYVMAAFVGGCAGPVKVVTPSGNNRVPVNTEEAIESFRGSLVREDVNAKSRAALEAQVVTLRQEILELKKYILTKAMEQERNTPKGLQATTGYREDEQVSFGSAEVIQRSKSNDQSFYMRRDGAALFVVRHAVGKTEFNADEAIKELLLNVAKTGTRIEVRGHTDAISPNAVDATIASARASNAHAFLVRNGIPALRIQTSHQSAGHFVSDNSTPEGMARNRRVEIEVFGISEPRLPKGG